MARSFKIYPEYNVVIIGSADEGSADLLEITKSLHDLSKKKNDYNFLVDGRNTNWKRIDTNELITAVLLTQAINLDSEKAAHVISDLEQLSFAQLIFESFPNINVQYFTSMDQACNFLKIPRNLVED